ncbi:hypothetical protein HMPREF1979_02849 [Actinomyces johnsonii F0542]|uniref:Uncharacterized protein n=1 Tax=Actinomyces johnsonii F0542 TaxID=1321818 RepID=U1QK33_9ACTO|nr:hypothetical protein HMPREF1979_02849 [Actinomyces johnsonii F0542]
MARQTHPPFTVFKRCDIQQRSQLLSLRNTHDHPDKEAVIRTWPVRTG